MSGDSCVDKLVEWRERMARFVDFRGTVAAFCFSERISAPSFYQWRKRLAAENGGVAGRAGAGFAAVRVIGTACVVGRLPGGTRLEIPTGDPEVLRLVIETLVRVDAERAGEGAC